MNRYISERIVLFSVCVLIPTIIQFYDFLYVTHNFSSFEVLSLFYVLAFGGLFPWIFKERIDDKYGIFSEIHLFSTYQYQRILFLVWFAALLYLIVVCSHLLDFMDKGLFCSVFFIIPILSLLFGTNVFHDSSCFVGDEILLGYPTVYPVASLIMGIFGFIFILNSNSNSEIILLITFIFQIILVLPHVINKFTPFEIRTKKGCLIFLTSTILLYALLIFILIGMEMFNSGNAFLTPRSFLMNILVYGGGMILVILFYRQFKKNG